MKLILDASITLSWLFERNETQEKSCSNKVASILPDVETFVPSLWHTEITNALLTGERRRVITEAQVIDFLNRLSQLPIITDDITVNNRRDIVMSLAREYRLTTYDAVYLELALRKNAILATFDIELANAMRSAGGVVFTADMQIKS